MDLSFRTIDPEADKDLLLELHCRIVHACESPAFRSPGYETYRAKWFSTGGPQEFLYALKASLTDARTFARIVLDRDGRFVGWVWVTFRDLPDFSVTVAELEDLYVDEELRGKGIASTVCGEAERHAREAGARLLRSGTGALNIGSVKFHMRNGFNVRRYEYEKQL